MSNLMRITPRNMKIKEIMLSLVSIASNRYIFMEVILNNRERHIQMFNSIDKFINNEILTILIKRLSYSYTMSLFLFMVIITDNSLRKYTMVRS